MAKRRKKEEEEEEEAFELPEFDREEYMRKEITKGKSILISVAVAPLFSILALQVFKLVGDWTVGFMVGLVGIALLSNIMKIFDIDKDKLEIKEWAMNAGMFIFTFVAIWIVLMNPPFNDFSDPHLNELDWQAYDDGEKIDKANITNGERYNITIKAKVTDNVEVKSVQIKFRGSQWENMTKNNSHIYTSSYQDIRANDSPYTVSVKMEDTNGHVKTITRDITISKKKEG